MPDTETRQLVQTYVIHNPMSQLSCLNLQDGFSASLTQDVTVGKTVYLRKDWPGWRRRVRLGLHAGNPYHMVWIDVSLTEGLVRSEIYKSASYCKDWGGYTHSGDLLKRTEADWPGLPSDAWTTNVENEARNAFIQRGLAQQRAFTGSTFIGEGLEAIRMVVRPGRTLRESIDRYASAARKAAASAARRRRHLNWDDYQSLSRKQKRAVSNAIAGTYLEHAFGWAPLMSDVQSGAKAVAAWVNDFRWQREHISAQKESDLPSAVTSYTFSLGYATVKWYRDQLSSERCRYTGAIGLEEKPPRDWVSHFGVTPRDFIPTVWELLPYSFLVDYFTNIGDLIEWAAYPRVDFKWWSRSSTRRVVRRCSTSHAYGNFTSGTPVNGSTRVTQFTPCVKTWERGRFRRTVGQEPLAPSLVFKIPGVGSSKWLNIGALASAKLLFR